MHVLYSKFRNFQENFIFVKLGSFEDIKPSQKHSVVTDEGKICPRWEFLTWQICLLTVFAEIKFSRKFRNLQYMTSCTCVTVTLVDFLE